MTTRLGVLLVCGVWATTACKSSPDEKLAAAERGDQDPPSRRNAPSKPAADEPPPARTVVSGSPGGLLKPGAEERIQQALADRGLLGDRHRKGSLDAPTEAAIRALQKREGMPETGVPDQATLRKLGLDPDALFVSTPKPEEADRAGDREDRDREAIKDAKERGGKPAAKAEKQRRRQDKESDERAREP